MDKTSGKLSFKAIGVSIANSQIIAKVNVGKAVHLTNWRFSFHAIVTSDIDIKEKVTDLHGSSVSTGTAIAETNMAAEKKI